MAIKGSSTLTGGGAGPRLGEVILWLEGQLEQPGVSKDSVVRVDRSAYINQFDTGGWRLGVDWGE